MHSCHSASAAAVPRRSLRPVRKPRAWSKTSGAETGASSLGSIIDGRGAQSRLSSWSITLSMREPRPSSSSSPIWGGRSASLRSICAMIPPDAGDAPTCGSGSLLAAADVLSNPVSSDGKPVACLMGAQLSAATGRSSDSSAAWASAKKSRARKAGSAARGRGPRSPPIMTEGAPWWRARARGCKHGPYADSQSLPLRPPTKV